MLRTKLYRLICKYIMLSAVCFVLNPSVAQATLSLSATPVSGGNTLRFGRVDLPSSTTQEVRLRVTSSGDNAYQVFQRINQSFQNERGETLGSDAILVSLLQGSNSAGSPELQTVESLSFADQLIYTSTNNGLSDSVTLIYQVDVSKIRSSGNFSGQIIYSLRPIGSGGRAEERILNVFLEVDGQLDIRQESGSGTDMIRLRSDNPTFAEDYFRIRFAGHRGGEIRLYQEVERYPSNELNQPLPEEAMSLWATGGDNGELALGQASALNRRRQLVYSSTGLEDEVWMQFRLRDDPSVRVTAGRYTGRLNYTIETDTNTQSLPLDIDIEIAPVFELSTEYPSGGVSFKRILPLGEPQLKEVIVTVDTNKAQPYLVSQNINTALTNDKGQQLEGEFFTFREELLDDSPGEVNHADFVTVPEGEQVLFYSDEFGSPARFRVIYRLRPHQKMKAGDYKTSVRYTLEEK